MVSRTAALIPEADFSSPFLVPDKKGAPQSALRRAIQLDVHLSSIFETIVITVFIIVIIVAVNNASNLRALTSMYYIYMHICIYDGMSTDFSDDSLMFLVILKSRTHVSHATYAYIHTYIHTYIYTYIYIYIADITNPFHLSLSFLELLQ